MPGSDPVQVERTIRRIVADSGVHVEAADTAVASPPSPLPPALEQSLERVTTSMWGPLPIVQEMETGATDGLFLRNAGMPVYGVCGLFVDPNNDEDMRAHGLNERIGVHAFYDQLEFTYRLLKAL